MLFCLGSNAHSSPFWNSAACWQLDIILDTRLVAAEPSHILIVIRFFRQTDISSGRSGEPIEMYMQPNGLTSKMHALSGDVSVLMPLADNDLHDHHMHAV